MHTDYKVGSLQADTVARAFVVIGQLFPAASFREWCLATATDIQRNDWLTATDRAGVIRGLCHLFVGEAMPTRQLEVPVFASISLFDERRIARVLFEVARERAEQEHCLRIHFWPAGLAAWPILVRPETQTAPRGGLLYDLQGDHNSQTSVFRTGRRVLPH